MAVTQIFYANLVPPNAGGSVKNSRISWLSCVRQIGSSPIGPCEGVRRGRLKTLNGSKRIENGGGEGAGGPKRRSSERAVENMGWAESAWEDDED